MALLVTQNLQPQESLIKLDESAVCAFALQLDRISGPQIQTGLLLGGIITALGH